jgi:hypothetical protein
MPTEYTLVDWYDAKRNLEDAKETLDLITRELSEEMLSAGIKSNVEYVDGTPYQVTVVQSEVVKFDETTLLKAMGKRAYSKIADLKLNKKKLEDAIKNGTVDADLVSRNAVISRNSPYLRVSPYTGED